MTIRDEVVIKAEVRRVWDLTIAVEEWPRLSPATMTSVHRLDEGPIRVASSAAVKQPRQRETTWTVTRLEPHRLFEWQAKLLTTTMTATHQLSPESDGCRNALTVELSGFGSRLLERLVGKKIHEAISIENQCFKTEAERST